MWSIEINGEWWETTPFLRFVSRAGKKLLQQKLQRGCKIMWRDIPFAGEVLVEVKE